MVRLKLTSVTRKDQFRLMFRVRFRLKLRPRLRVRSAIGKGLHFWPGLVSKKLKNKSNFKAEG